MNDALLVHVLEPVADLLDDGGCFLLGQLPLLLDLLQTAIGQGLNDEVQVFLVVEIAEERSDVGLVEIGLDLDLAQNVVFHLHLADPLLRHLLNHADKANVLLLRHIHVSECALPQLVQDLKIAELDLSLRLGVSPFFSSQRLF